MKNIVFYFSDQQRYDTITPELTPNICSLAEEGVLFENNFTCQPVCGPARACLQSGVYATQTGCFRNAIPLPEQTKTLADHFNEAGYQTAYIGKWHLASDFLPGIGVHCKTTAVPKKRQGGYSYWRAADVLEFTSHGYDGYVFDENGNKLDFTGYRADAINDFALEFLDNRDKSKPFFMFISQLEPHHQNDHGCFEGYRETVDTFRTYPVPPDLEFLEGDYREQLPDYLSAINRLDHNVGRLAEKLKELGIYEDTVIVYTSDHGCHFKTRNLEYKRCCHENTVHTPLVIRGGEYTGGKKIAALTSLIDMPATLLSIAGIPIPSSYMGFDIKDTLNNGKRIRDNVFIQISESQCGRAIRTERYMYSVRSAAKEGFLMSSSWVYFEDYLYDMEKDPYQKTNLIKDPAYADVRNDLKQILLSEMQKAGEKRAVIRKALKVRKI